MEHYEITCPECGAEAEVFYRDKSGYIVGCEECIDKLMYYEVGGQDD